ncbi:MAG: HAMP domain-containing histidine kinase [Clostridiaceae bacterium]|nr:HAMP domain-containing histidine kinase [Clostridiaceae bacterium]
MFRNREIRIYIFSLLLVILVGAIACFMIKPAAGTIFLSASLLIAVISIVFTRWRYIQIEKLSNYLNRIADGDYSIDLRDNREGELSILKNEIYKVTVTLREQAALLKQDKIFLANAISDISHQLKTPITSMVVMTDLISDENLPEEKRREFVRNIQSQLERLQWLVSSLLKLSKIDAGTIEFKKDPVKVRKLIDKSLEHLLIPMELKEQSLEINGDENVEFIGDFNWSCEAVSNIIKNCIEHTPQGGRIGIEYCETSLYTIIRIYDNGEGIHRDDLPYIFNRFYKGKNSSKESIGIGLAMSKSIIESQGGTIEAESHKGKGTQFILKFHKGVV